MNEGREEGRAEKKERNEGRKEKKEGRDGGGVRGREGRRKEREKF